ncbi:MAG: type IIL restriction-modification enzyme MmeI [Nitrosomonas sp.]
MQPDTFCSNLVFMLPNATLHHFGILTSIIMHNAWMRTVCRRLKNDYRHSPPAKSHRRTNTSHRSCRSGCA